MLSPGLFDKMLDVFITYSTVLLLPTMFTVFAGCIISRLLIYYTIWREMVFVKEFDKRVGVFIESTSLETKLSFYGITKKLLEKTFYELFVVRAIMKRRNPDLIMTMSDRIFLTKQGAAWLVHDMLKQIRHLRHERTPQLLPIVKSTVQNNPCFNKVFGLIPAGTVNDLLKILPGLLIVGGIFGTFLGVMRALPQLGMMDLSDIDETKIALDNFLLQVSYAMVSSVLGITFSVVLSIFNSLFSPEKLFVRIIHRFENAVDKLWTRSDHNELVTNLVFDEHRDPLEALAEEALNQELEKDAQFKQPHRGKTSANRSLEGEKTAS